MPDGSTVEIIDLPGIYSIYPRSLDEQIVAEVLLDHHSPTTPDKIIVIVDGTNLKRGFLLLTQIIDLGLPTILALNMMDLAAKAGISYDFNALSKKLGCSSRSHQCTEWSWAGGTESNSWPNPWVHQRNKYSIFGKKQKSRLKNFATNLMLTTTMKRINFSSSHIH